MRLRAGPALALCVGAIAALPLAAQQETSVNPILDCTACHKLPHDGGGALAVIPNLVGQPTRYLERQLDAYRTGMRLHPQMQATATALGQGGAAGMARMYGMLDFPDLRAPEDIEAVREGQRIVSEGLWQKGVPPCASCHGLGEAKQGRLAPYLHGQPQGYLLGSLNAYADGSRRSDPMGRMRAFSAAMSAAERQAVAAYYAAFALEPVPETESDQATASTQPSDTMPSREPGQ